jgi:peroxiredoxin
MLLRYNKIPGVLLDSTKHYGRKVTTLNTSRLLFSCFATRLPYSLTVWCARKKLRNVANLNTFEEEE